VSHKCNRQTDGQTDRSLAVARSNIVIRALKLEDNSKTGTILKVFISVYNVIESRWLPQKLSASDLSVRWLHQGISALSTYCMTNSTATTIVVIYG